MKNPVRNGLLLAILIFIADQLSKWWMLDKFKIATRSPIELTPFFKLVMVWNRGVSFGMMNSVPFSHLLFSGLSFLICCLLILWLVKAKLILTLIGVGIIIGGAMANTIDRLRFGAVADFFYFHIADYYWPAFNIADAAICIGAGCIIIESVISKKHEKTS